jgi:hypothetical protein
MKMKLVVLLTMFAVSCSPAASTDSSQHPLPRLTPTGDRAADEATLRRLYDEARAIARTDGCPDGAACKAAPMGTRACGGPNAYVVYCPATTDERALNAKLDQLADFEDKYNRQYGVISICVFETAPELESANGVCRAK